MYINKFFRFFMISCVLAGCAQVTRTTNDWSGQYGTFVEDEPTPINYGAVASDSVAHNIAILLPLSGDSEAVGRAIRMSAEMAILEKAPDGFTASFYDTAHGDINEVVETALSSNPDAIVGPVFSDDVNVLRDAKSSDVPVLSFTSDIKALGDGVMTMALMPINSVEAIVQEMHQDNMKDFIIVAPDSSSGRMMAGAAIKAAKVYNIPVDGVFYYNESDTESIKNMAAKASMNEVRVAANNRARQILSDIVVNEQLDAIEKTNMEYQLEKLSKMETLGAVPYDAILFLGNGNDTLTITSFLRYYDVGARDTRFYGTALWDGVSEIASDYTMVGAKFAALPQVNENFVALYQQMTGDVPGRLSSFGYDAVNMAINMIYSGKSGSDFLLASNGYVGTDGVFRLMPNGASERGLRIMTLDGSGAPREIKGASNTFVRGLYNINPDNVSEADAMDLVTDGVDPDNYIKVPSRLQYKYNSDIIGAADAAKKSVQKSKIVAIVGGDETAITSTEYVPVKQESVSRTFIDSVEIEE